LKATGLAGGGRRGHAVGDATWGIGSIRPWVVDSDLIWCVSGLGGSRKGNGISINNYWGYDS
jgi:hypothetical protein